MEVNADEVEAVTYSIPSEDWKAEEKREHWDGGRMYSAPSILSGNPKEPGTTLSIGRKYHRAGHLLAQTMTQAGEFLQLRIPLAGEYKLGDSWADTH